MAPVKASGVGAPKMSFLVCVFALCCLVHNARGDIGQLLLVDSHASSPKQADDSICMIFDPRWQAINASAGTDPYELVWVRPRLGCVSDNESRIDNGGELRGRVAVFERGSCVFSTKVLAAASYGAAGVVIVSQAHTSMSLPIAANASDYDTVNLPVAMIQHKDAAQLMNRSNPYVIFRASSSGGVDSNIMLFVLLTFIVIMAGTFWAGNNFEDEWLTAHGKPPRHHEQRRSGMDPSSAAAAAEEEDEEELVIMSPRCVLIFIVVACVMLLLMYFFYNVMIYLIIGIFALGGSLSLARILLVVFSPYLPSGPVYTIPCVGLCSVRTITTNLSCLVLGCIWIAYRNSHWSWVLQDMMGVSLMTSALAFIRVPSFRSATLLLVLFVVYDVFFVFITPLLTPDNDSIMVSAATGGGSSSEMMPIVIRVPRFNPPPCQEGDSMLGFGDIIVPGIVIAFCHLFDTSKQLELNEEQPSIVAAPCWTRHAYLIVSVTAYFFGLLCTYVALYGMNSAQPALLYLGPSLIVFIVIASAIRGELNAIWEGIPDVRRPRRASPTNSDDEEEEDGDDETNQRSRQFSPLRTREDGRPTGPVVIGGQPASPPPDDAEIESAPLLN